MKKLLIFTIAISLVTLGAFWSGQKVCGMVTANILTSQALYRQLGLDPGQTAALKSLDGVFQKNADKVCASVCLQRQELIDLMKAEYPNKAAIDQKINSIGRLQIDFEKQTAAHILEVRAMLTPEQADKYLDRVEGQFQQALKKSGFGEYCRMGS